VNQFRFAATGKYMVQASAPMYFPVGHIARIREEPAGATVLTGTSATTLNLTTRSFIEGVITVSSTTQDYVLEHYNAFAELGPIFGTAAAAAGVLETYTVITIWRL